MEPRPVRYRSRNGKMKTILTIIVFLLAAYVADLHFYNGKFFRAAGEIVTRAANQVR